MRLPTGRVRRAACGVFVFACLAVAFGAGALTAGKLLATSIVSDR